MRSKKFRRKELIKKYFITNLILLYIMSILYIIVLAVFAEDERCEFYGNLYLLGCGLVYLIKTIKLLFRLIKLRGEYDVVIENRAFAKECFKKIKAFQPRKAVILNSIWFITFWLFIGMFIMIIPLFILGLFSFIPFDVYLYMMIIFFIVSLGTVFSNDSIKKTYAPKLIEQELKEIKPEAQLNAKKRSGYRFEYLFDDYVSSDCNILKSVTYPLDIGYEITIYDFLLQNLEMEANGNRWVTQFHGQVSTLKNYSTNLKKAKLTIINRRIKNDDDQHLINMDMPEFDNCFSVYCEDEGFAKRVLSSAGFMEKLMDISRRYDWDFDILIKGKRIYIRNYNDSFINTGSAGRFLNEEEILSDILTFKFEEETMKALYSAISDLS
jgi:hypothetical protein